MRGRKPKPPGLRIRRNKRPEGDLAPGKPIDPAGMPDWLGPVAAAEWRRVVTMLLDVEAASDWDRALLVDYCVSWERWVSAEREVQRLGQLVKSTKTGEPMRNPFVGIAQAAHDRLLKLAGELRLSPVSRARAPITKRSLGSIDPASLRTVAEDRDEQLQRVANVLEFRA